MVQYPNYNAFGGYNQMQNNGLMYPPQMQGQTGLQGQNTAQMPIQNGGLVSVHSEAEARNYPVAHGNSITFKDENAPYVYVKTMGFSQLDRPTFDRFRLVKEEAETAVEPAINNETDNLPLDDIKADISEIRGDIEAIRKQVKTLQASKNKRLVKELIEEDEDND